MSKLNTLSKAVALAGVAAILAAALPGQAAVGPERSLAGIYIGRPASLALKRYGNPTRVDTQQFQGQADMSAAAGAPQAGMALPSPGAFGLTAPGAGGGPAGLESPSAGGPGNMSGALGNPMTSMFGPPTGQPFGAAPMAGAFTAPGAAAPVMSRPISKLYYDYATGPTLVFTVGQRGLVEQIDAFAPWPWGPAKTSRGINVGSSYKSVVGKYGYPEQQRQNPDGTLVMDYSERAHVAFTMLDGKVVGVTVALVE